MGVGTSHLEGPGQHLYLGCVTSLDFGELKGTSFVHPAQRLALHQLCSSGSQDTAEYLKAVDICGEVLVCLERRKVSWLMLFQLTETGEKSCVPGTV